MRKPCNATGRSPRRGRISPRWSPDWPSASFARRGRGGSDMSVSGYRSRWSPILTGRARRDRRLAVLAFLVLLEELVAAAAGAFLLREVFDYPYAEAAEIIGTDVDSTRHLVARARNHIQQRRPRYAPLGGSEKSWLSASRRRRAGRPAGAGGATGAGCGAARRRRRRARRWRGRSTAGSGWHGPGWPGCPPWHASVGAYRPPRSTASPAPWRTTRPTGCSGSWNSASPTARSRRSTPSPIPTSFDTSTGSATSVPGCAQAADPATTAEPLITATP